MRNLLEGFNRFYLAVGRISKDTLIEILQSKEQEETVMKRNKPNLTEISVGIKYSNVRIIGGPQRRMRVLEKQFEDHSISSLGNCLFF